MFQEARTRHPMPTCVMFLAEAIKRLRMVKLQDEEQSDESGRDEQGSAAIQYLYRGMRDVTAPEEFCLQGGTEVSPMSTTTKLEVALTYAASDNSLILRLQTSSFMQRGADLEYLSCFGTEKEILFPPLTFLEPTGTKEEFEFDGRFKYTVVEVRPHL